MKDSYFWSLEMIGGEKINETNFVLPECFFFGVTQPILPFACRCNWLRRSLFRVYSDHQRTWWISNQKLQTKSTLSFACNFKDFNFRLIDILGDWWIFQARYNWMLKNSALSKLSHVMFEETAPFFTTFYNTTLTFRFSSVEYLLALKF